MIIAEAVLTFILALLCIVGAGILFSIAMDEISGPPLIGSFVLLIVGVLTAVFQGVALTGSLVVTDAVFTYIATIPAAVLAALLLEDSPQWALFTALVGMIAVVFQSVVCAM